MGIIPSIMNEISSHVEKAIAEFGSQASLAQAAGVAQPTIHKALKSGRVGLKLAIGIDRATAGKISKGTLRPDLWPESEVAA